MIIRKKILISLLLFCAFSFAQKKIDVKYFINNVESPIESARIFLVTKSDTITQEIVEGKIILAEDVKENFSLFAQINHKVVKIGSFRPAMFEKLIDGIVIGRITDFSTLKKSSEFPDAFIIGAGNLIAIPDSMNISDMIYSIIRKDVDTSRNSAFFHIVPEFTSSYEVIKLKN